MAITNIGYRYSFPPSIDEDDADALSNEKYRAVLSFNPVKVDAATVGSLIGKDNILAKILSGDIDSLEDLGKFYNENFNPLVKRERESRNIPGEGASSEELSRKEQQAVRTNLVARRTAENTVMRGKHSDDLGIPQNRYVHLYMPMNITQNESVVAGPEQLGIAGGMVASTLAGGDRSVVDIAKSAYKGTVTGLGELLEGKASGEFGSLIAQRLVSKLSTNVGNAVSLGTRIAVNPNTRAIFKQVNIREWNFAFQMIPTSPYESTLIENIIDFFRMEQLPTELVSAAGGGVGMAYQFPNLMHIKALYRDERTGRYKPILTRFLPAYLQAVDVTYNTTGMSFYEGGKFHDATMNLKFIEYRPLNKDDIDVERKYLGKGDKIRHGV